MIISITAVGITDGVAKWEVRVSLVRGGGGLGVSRKLRRAKNPKLSTPAPLKSQSPETLDHELETQKA